MEAKKLLKCVVDDNGQLGVYAIGLVQSPAIEERWIALADIKLSEVQAERKMLYGAALVPDKKIYRYDKDRNEEYYVFFDQPTIEKCAHMFLQQNHQHDHTYEHIVPITGCTVVESWLVESEQDKSRAFGMDVPVGTWMIGVKVHDEQLWSKVLDKSVTGFSIEGRFEQVLLSRAQFSSDDSLDKRVEGALIEISELLSLWPTQ